MFGLIKKNDNRDYHPVGRLWSDMDRLFENFFDSEMIDGVRNPAINMRENDGAYLVDAELPGVSEKEVDLTVENGVVTIDVNREEKEGKNGYRTFRYHRSFTLPDDADPEKIDASLKNGLLTLEMKKRPETKTRQLKIAVK